MYNNSNYNNNNNYNIRKILAYILAVFLSIMIFSSMLSVLSFALFSSNIFTHSTTSTISLIFDDSDINSLEIDLSVVDLTVKSGSKFSLESNLESEYLDSYINENKTLCIKDLRKNNYFNSKKYNIVLTVPYGFTFDDVFINNDVSEIDINTLNSKSISIMNDVGEIKLDCMNTDYLFVENNVGLVSITTEAVLNMELQNDVGNLNIVISDDKYNYNITTTKNLGSVKVDGIDINEDISNTTANNNIAVNLGIGHVNIDFDNN